MICKSINPQCFGVPSFRVQEEEGKIILFLSTRQSPSFSHFPSRTPRLRILRCSSLSHSPQWCCCQSSISPHEIPSLEHPAPLSEPGSFPKCRDPGSAPGRGRGVSQSQAKSVTALSHAAGSLLPAQLESCASPPTQNGGCF